MKFTMNDILLYLLALFGTCVQLSTASSHGFEREDLLLSLDGTNYCSSLLLSKEMKISLQKLSEIYSKNIKIGVNKELDKCCLSHYKCAYMKFQTNQTNDPYNWHCECETQFRNCLKELDTPLSSELGFGRSLYIRQCVQKELPINQCEIYEEFLRPGIDIQGVPRKRDIESNSVRCRHYSLRDDETEQYQLFDTPFNYNGFSDEEMETIRRNHHIKTLLSKVHGFTRELHSFVKNIRSFHRTFNS